MGAWVAAFAFVALMGLALTLLAAHQQCLQSRCQHCPPPLPPQPGWQKQPQTSRAPTSDRRRRRKRSQERQHESHGINGLFGRNVHVMETSAHLRLGNIGQFAFRQREICAAQAGEINLGNFNNTAPEGRASSPTGSLDSLHSLDQVDFVNANQIAN